MYRYTRTATVKNGADVQRAMAIAGEITAYVNKLVDIDLQCGIELFNGNRIHWSADFPSLAVFEQKFAKLMADDDYFALIGRARELWVDGTLQDVIYKRIV